MHIDLTEILNKREEDQKGEVLYKLSPSKQEMEL